MNTYLHGDGASVVAGGLGPATGELWLTIDGQEFPAPRWSDFIVVILEWWCTATLRLLRRTSARELVDFMDGPYAVEVATTAANTLRFRALTGSRRTQVRAVGEQSAEVFVAELLSLANAVLDSCRRQGCQSSDTERLGTATLALAKLARGRGWSK